MELKFTIYAPPTSKKNSQQIVRPKGRPPIIVQSKTYKEYEKACKPFMPKLKEPISTPVNVEAVFYRKDRRRVDLVNLQGALLDCMVKYGVIADDNRNIVFTMNNSKVLYDKNASRTEVRITDVPEGEFEPWEVK